MEVKKAIQLLKDLNAEAFRRSERTGVRVPPPRPYMLRSEFDELVRTHCPDDEYASNPSLLLDFLHQSGFVYANSRHLPDHVILDQRWIVDGIYTLFHRKRCWTRLIEARGRFTASDLADWAWNDEGFTPEEQRDFLNFMQACGVCFELVPADKKGGVEALYLAPAALPSGDSRAIVEEARDHRGDLPPQSTVRLGEGQDMLSCDAALALLVRLGRVWRRSPVLWRWGGQFRSYRTELHEGDPTVVHLDWRPHSPESYGGVLTLTQYGDDASFLSAIVEECRGLSGFAGIELPSVSTGESARRVTRGRRRPEQTTGPGREPEESFARGEIGLADHEPGPEDARGVEIGISYAGDREQTTRGSPGDDSMLGEGSIERWPRALARRLRRLGFKVEDYRTEQGLPVHLQEPSLKRALDRLTSRDFMIAFLSWRYLTSELCMYEFLRIRRRMPNGQHDPAVLRVAAFPDGLCWPGAEGPISPGEASRLGRFREHWTRKRDEFWERVKADLGSGSQTDAEALMREAKSYVHYDWIEFVRTGLDEVVRDLRERMKSIPVAATPTEEELAAWCEEIAMNVGRADVLRKYAKEAWVRGTVESDPTRQREERARARRLFTAACRREVEANKRGGDWRTLLGEELDDEVLNDIRRSLL